MPEGTRFASLAALAVVGLIAAAAPAQEAPETPEAPEAGPAARAVDPRVREQLLTFAPYVSMRSRLTIGLHRPADVAGALTEWTRMREEEENLFSGNTLLQSAYRDFRAFLVATHAGIIPALQALNLEGLEALGGAGEIPEVQLGAMLLIAMAEIQKNRIVMDWYEQHDAKCRAAYKRVFPLLKQAARGKEWSDRSVSVRHWFTDGKGDSRGVFLEALNQSGRTLTNVSLRVVLETLDGRSCEHYYFIKEWPSEGSGASENRFTLVPAADWWAVGADATTRATVDVVSDEILVSGVRSEIKDQVPTAADKIMNEVAAELAARTHPRRALIRLAKIRPLIAAYPDRAARADGLTREAQGVLDEAVERVDARIKESREAIKRLEVYSTKERPDAKKRREARLKEEREKFRALEAERLRWNKGEETAADRERAAAPQRWR